MTAGVKRRVYMKKLTNFSAAICDELKKTVEQIDENQARAFFELIQKKRSRAIFILGAGRCQYMLRAFCMRLMHLEFEAYMVGDTTTPAINQGDLLIVADGAGYLTTIAETVRLAKSHGAEIAMLTILPDSLIGSMADGHVVIPGRTAAHGGVGTSIQPGGGRFEQSLLIFLDTIIAALVEDMGLPWDAPFQRHSNLE